MSEEVPKQPGFRERVGHIGRRGREELTRKGGIPDTAHGAFRKWSRKTWELRGGGAYAMGFIVTFLYLETMDILFDDVPKLVAMQSLVSDIPGFIIEFIIDTLLNLMWAFIWPVLVLQLPVPWNIIILAGVFILFPKFVQKPVEHWLYEGKEPPPKKSKTKKSKKAKQAS